jgi:hypothetical protein
VMHTVGRIEPTNANACVVAVLRREEIAAIAGASLPLRSSVQNRTLNMGTRRKYLTSQPSTNINKRPVPHSSPLRLQSPVGVR